MQTDQQILTSDPITPCVSDDLMSEQVTGPIVAFCNPLLDISANVDEDLLTKYGLKANDAILAEEKHLPLYQELVTNYNVLYTAGGSAQNTMRAAQWHLPPHSTVFVGCIGRDEYGARLKAVAEADGLCVEYLIDEAAPTGTCACLITQSGRCRSLVANLGAANHYKDEHVKGAHMSAVLHKAACIYFSGYFLTVSPSAIMHVASEARLANKKICLNLSAPFICQFFLDPLLKLLPFVDILFGNESEALALSMSLDLGTEDLVEIGKRLSQLNISSASSPRLVILTHGSQPTLVIQGDNSVSSFSVDTLSADQIVDTNGAGDAFAGGFLSQLVQGKSVESCINAGHYTAGVIIRRAGITFPSRPQDLSF